MITPKPFGANQIWETAVYDGRLKEWRVLNLNTGSVYSCAEETEIAALVSIKDGEKRGNYIVKRVKLSEIRDLLFMKLAGPLYDNGFLAS